MENFNFDYVYNDANTKEILFNPEWRNGTGYFDGLVNTPVGLEPNEFGRSYCPDSKRKMIIQSVGEFGNIVFFQRYTAGEHYVVVCNAPQVLRSLLCLEGSISDDTVGHVFNAVKSLRPYSLIQKLWDIKEAHKQVAESVS
jgi:hypothetical protein